MRLFHLIAFILITIALAIGTLAAPGDLDTSFGNGGKVLTQFGTSQDEGRAIAIQPDGKIVVAGFTDPGFALYDFAVARYNSDGSLDSSFGTGGKVTINFGTQPNGNGTVDQAFGLALQADGKILVGGYSKTGNTSRFAIARLGSTGPLDTSFGSNGLLITALGGSAGITSLAVQTDGKIIAAGTPAIVRYNVDGSLDTTFNGTGIVDISSSLVNASGLALRSDGKIVVTGTIAQDFAVGRFNTDGTLDVTFGMRTYPVGPTIDFANAVAVQPDNSVIVFGTATMPSSGSDLAVIKVADDGGLDVSFGNGGKTIIPISATLGDKAWAGAIQSDGKIVAAGYAQVGTANDPDFAVVRLKSNGTPDATFGANGVVTTNLSANNNDDVIYGVAVQPDGKIVAAGESNSLAVNSAQDFALARYIGSPCSVSLTPTSQFFDVFGGNGTINVSAPSTCSWQAAPNDPWVTITGASSGMGNGTIQFSVQSNVQSSVARTGTIAINDQTFTVFQGPNNCPSVVVGGAQVVSGTTAFPSINVGDLTGMNVLSFSMTVTYDPSVVTFAGIDTAGTMASSYTVADSLNTPGSLKIAGYGTSPLVGSGQLLHLHFTAIGAVGSSTPVTLSSVEFNEGGCVSIGSPGTVTVVGNSISGNVLYGTSTTPIGVSGVRVDAASVPSGFAVTNTSGAYTIAGLGTGGGVLTPSLPASPPVNGITGADASAVLQYVVGIDPLTSNQLIAADVSGNGTVTAFDAALIARYVVGLPNTVFTGSWRFAPPQRTYSGLPTNLSGQDFSAILMGEITGNWSPSGTSFAKSLLAFPSSFGLQTNAAGLPKSVVLQLSDVKASAGPVTLPVQVTNMGRGQTLGSYQFDVIYDPRLIVPQASPVTTGGTLSSGFAFETNASAPGRLRVVVYGIDQIRRNGILLNLQFDVPRPLKTKTALTIQSALLNEGTPFVTTQAGSIGR